MTAGRSPRRFAPRYSVAPFLAILTALTAGCATGGGGLLGSAATADPQSLIGLAPQQISEALGSPELQRREPPAEVWQYRTAICVFDLYLYEEAEGSRAAHYAARSRSNDAIDPATCLGSVVERYRVAAAEDTDQAPTPSS